MSWPRSPPRCRTLPGRVHQPRDGILDARRAQPRIVDRGDRVASDVLGVLEDVRDGVDGADRPPAPTRTRPSPRRWVCCAIQPPMYSSSMCWCSTRPAWSANHGSSTTSGMADQAHHPLRDRLGAGGQAQPLAVARLVRVAGRGPVGAAAGPVLDLAQLVVHQRLRAQQPEQGLVDGEVDDLAGAAVHVAVPQREHRGEGPEHRRDAVTQRERRQRRRTVRLAVDMGEAADRLGHRAEPGPRAVGPGLPVAASSAPSPAGG